MSQVLADSALAEAAARDASGASGAPVGPLHGVPMVIKEEIDVAGCVTTFGGLANSAPAEADSEVVRRLRAAGAVIVGKTQMPEFGSFPLHRTRSLRLHAEPLELGMSPGGSSGGTAVAVATGMAVAGSAAMAAARSAFLPHALVSLGSSQRGAA
ncbi:MAG: amidase family protein [Marmoricola sp.]